MTNDDLLQQIDKLIQKRLTEAVDPLNERLDTQQERLVRIEKNLSEQIAQQGEQIAKVEKHIIEQFSPITNMVLDHDEKIDELQKAVGLRPKH
jgi:hypothetical protein